MNINIHIALGMFALAFLAVVKAAGQKKGSIFRSTKSLSSFPLTVLEVCRLRLRGWCGKPSNDGRNVLLVRLSQAASSQGQTITYQTASSSLSFLSAAVVLTEAAYEKS